MVVGSLVLATGFVSLNESEILIPDLALRLGDYQGQRVVVADSLAERAAMVVCADKPADEVWKKVTSALRLKWGRLPDGSLRLEPDDPPEKNLFQPFLDRYRPYRGLSPDEIKREVDKIARRIGDLETKKPQGWQEERARLSVRELAGTDLGSAPILKKIVDDGLAVPLHRTQVLKLADGRWAAFRYDGFTLQTADSEGGAYAPNWVSFPPRQPWFEPSNPREEVYLREGDAREAVRFLATREGKPVVFESNRTWMPAHQGTIGSVAVNFMHVCLKSENGWLVGQTFTARTPQLRLPIRRLQGLESQPFSRASAALLASGCHWSALAQRLVTRWGLLQMDENAAGLPFLSTLTEFQIESLHRGSPVYYRDMTASQRSRFRLAVTDEAAPEQAAQFAAQVKWDDPNLAFYVSEFKEDVLVTQSGATTVVSSAWSDPSQKPPPESIGSSFAWLIHFGVDNRHCATYRIWVQTATK